MATTQYSDEILDACEQLGVGVEALKLAADKLRERADRFDTMISNVLPGKLEYVAVTPDELSNMLKMFYDTLSGSFDTVSNDIGATLGVDAHGGLDAAKEDILKVFSEPVMALALTAAGLLTDEDDTYKIHPEFVIFVARMVAIFSSK